MRNDSAFLNDVASACRKIEEIIAATDEHSFVANEVLQAAVLHHLAVIGEAISRMSSELRDRHSDVPWHQIVAVRHRIVHAYFDLDWQILWDTAKFEIGPLRDRVMGILKAEFSESGAVS